MKLADAIDVLRALADAPDAVAVGSLGARHVALPSDVRQRAARLVHKYDNLPRAADVNEAEPTTVTIGTKSGRVVFQSSGTAEVEPSFIVWTPAQAREVAAKLIQLAESLEPSIERTPTGYFPQ